MATDARLIRTDQDVVAIGGTGTGVDTALLIKPTNASIISYLKIREVIAKPRDF